MPLLSIPTDNFQLSLLHVHILGLHVYRTSSNSSSLGTFVWFHRVPLLHSTYVTKIEIHAKGGIRFIKI